MPSHPSLLIGEQTENGLAAVLDYVIAEGPRPASPFQKQL
jgi:hypothetical protein